MLFNKKNLIEVHLNIRKLSNLHRSDYLLTNKTKLENELNSFEYSRLDEKKRKKKNDFVLLFYDDFHD